MLRKKKKTATHDKLLFPLSLPFGFLLREKHCAKKMENSDLHCRSYILWSRRDLYIVWCHFLNYFWWCQRMCTEQKEPWKRQGSTSNSKLTASVILHIPTSEFKHARFVSNVLGITHLWQDSHAHYLGRSQCQTSFPQSQQLTLYDVKEYKNNHRAPS